MIFFFLCKSSYNQGKKFGVLKNEILKKQTKKHKISMCKKLRITKNTPSFNILKSVSY